MYRGIATFTLDDGRCPKWLFERMVKLGRAMAEAIIAEEGPDEFICRIADPVWFQSLGTVLAFDWNASGLTTTLTAALKEALRGHERELGVFICGGKGKTSRKTPVEIETWGERLALPESATRALTYNSRMAAKVDSALIQDGFGIYHHSFFFTRSGAWTVVQQGMNPVAQTARRYHWHSARVKELVCEPHTGIASQTMLPVVLNLSAVESKQSREVSTQLVSQSFGALFKDIQLLEKYSTRLSRTVRLKTSAGQLTLLDLAPREFHKHPVLGEDFSRSTYLKKILWKLCDEKPGNYERLLATPGVGSKTVRALALVGEIIWGAAPSYRDPARYSFAHGGKDETPFPIDRETYDRTIAHIRRYVQKLRLKTQCS